MPATVPAPQAFTNSGVPELHARMHGRNLFEQENVRAYGALGDGVTDDTAACQAAIDAAAGRTVFFPKGTYKLTSSLILPSYVTLRGAGPRRGGASLTGKNFYLLKVNASGCFEGTVVEDMNLGLDPTSTSGGCIQFKNNCYISAPLLRNLEMSGSTLSSDPVVHLGTWVGGRMTGCNITGGQISLKLGGAGLGFVSCNLNIIDNCTIGTLSTIAGAQVEGGAEGNTFLSCDFESCHGNGIIIHGAANSTHLQACWFESNQKTDIYLEDAWQVSIRDCHFVALNGSPNPSYFVDIRSTGAITSGSASRFVTIENNLCLNYPEIGVGNYTHFNIGSGVYATTINNNMMWDPNNVGVIADAGTLTESRRNMHRLFNGNSTIEQMRSWQEIDVGNRSVGGPSISVKDVYNRRSFRTTAVQGSSQGGVVVGHVFGNTADFPAGVVVGAAAGSGATATLVGSDAAGQVTVNTGTGTSTGTLFTLNFTAPYDAVSTKISVVATFESSPAPIGGNYWINQDHTQFFFKVDTAPTASTTYRIAYQVVGMTVV
jgi:Endopolygalacturonase